MSLKRIGLVVGGLESLAKSMVATLLSRPEPKDAPVIIMDAGHPDTHRRLLEHKDAEVIPIVFADEPKVNVAQEIHELAFVKPPLALSIAEARELSRIDEPAGETVMNWPPQRRSMSTHQTHRMNFIAGLQRLRRHQVGWRR